MIGAAPICMLAAMAGRNRSLTALHRHHRQASVMSLPRTCVGRKAALKRSPPIPGTCPDGGVVGYFARMRYRFFFPEAAELMYMWFHYPSVRYLRTVVLDRHIGVPRCNLSYKRSSLFTNTEKEVPHGRIAVSITCVPRAFQHNVTSEALVPKSDKSFS